MIEEVKKIEQNEIGTEISNKELFEEQDGAIKIIKYFVSTKFSVDWDLKNQPLFQYEIYADLIDILEKFNQEKMLG